MGRLRRALAVAVEVIRRPHEVVVVRPEVYDAVRRLGPILEREWKGRRPHIAWILTEDPRVIKEVEGE